MYSSYVEKFSCHGGVTRLLWRHEVLVVIVFTLPLDLWDRDDKVLGADICFVFAEQLFCFSLDLGECDGRSVAW